MLGSEEFDVAPPAQRHAVLALDLATTTGWAWIDQSMSRGKVGSMKLASDKELKGALRWRNQDIRFNRLLRWIFEWLRTTTPRGPVAIVWEDVQFVSSSQQFSIWSFLRAAIWGAVEKLDLPLQSASVALFSVPVGTLKKYATGSGSAGKDGMANAARRRGLNIPSSLDDNAVDAAWLLHYYVHTIEHPTHA